MEIVLVIIGAILGVLVNELWVKFKYRNSNNKRYKRAVGKVRSIGFIPEAGFKYLDHAIPKYSKENLKTILSEEKLIISVPESFKTFFDEHKFEIREATTNL